MLPSESWRRFCPGWEIREWGNDFVSTVDNRYVREAMANRKWAFVADWVRLYALVHHGGFYLDTDMEMEKPFDDFLGEKFVLYFWSLLSLNCRSSLSLS